MRYEKYEKIRNIFREYRLLQNELESRTKYIEEFRKILVRPLPKTEESLHRIYETIINDMEETAKKLSERLSLIESTVSKLDGPERNVMYYRYIVGIEWISIPEYMMYEQRTCQLYETKALNKIIKMDIRWD